MIQYRDQSVNARPNREKARHTTTIRRFREVLQEIDYHILKNMSRDECIADGELVEASNHDALHTSALETIKLFKLNKLQAIAFALAAKALLKKFSAAYHDDDEIDQSNPAQTKFSLFIG